MKKILILGGGFAGIEFYKTLHKKLHSNHNYVFQLVSQWNYFLFYPMLHEVATGSVERSHITHPIREIMNCCLETFTQGTVESIDFEQKKVKTNWGDIQYDYLVIALGSEPNFFNIDGAETHCITFKTIADATKVRNTILRHVEAATRTRDAVVRKKLLSFAIIGGGPTGVELAGQLADLLYHEIPDLYIEIDPKEISITLIDSSDRLLKQMSPELSAVALERLKKMNVNVVLQERVEHCHSDGVHLCSGVEVNAGLRVWAAGTQSAVRSLVHPDYLTQRGYLKTESTLQLIEHPEVFVVGDTMEVIRPAPMMVPQTGQVATAAARCAAENLLAMIHHKPLKKFTFVSLGDIIPIGDWFAVAQIGSIRFSGRLAWLLRRFVFLQRIWSWVNRTKICIDWILHSILRRDTSEL